MSSDAMDEGKAMREPDCGCHPKGNRKGPWATSDQSCNASRGRGADASWKEAEQRRTTPVGTADEDHIVSHCRGKCKRKCACASRSNALNSPPSTPNPTPNPTRGGGGTWSAAGSPFKRLSSSVQSWYPDPLSQ
eukprot:3940690-Rhodomonas_salina.3